MRSEWGLVEVLAVSLVLWLVIAFVVPLYVAASVETFCSVSPVCDSQTEREER